MKKSILLVAKSLSVQDMYLGELRSVFEGCLNILPYWQQNGGEITALSQNVEKADVVLITNPYSFPQIRDHLKKDASIVNLNFAFVKEKVDELRKLPVGTETLACFNYYSTAHQAVNFLYDAGLRNLNLYVHYPGNRNVLGKKIDVAIISGPTGEIPAGIPRVIDLGQRKLALSTILDIAVRADVLDEKLEEAISSYCDQISITDDYISYFFNSSSTTQMQLKTITNCIDYSIVFLDNDYRVIDCNQNFSDMFGLSQTLKGSTMDDIPWHQGISELICSHYQFKNKLFEIKSSGKQILISKEKVNKSDKNYNIFIILMKDVTEIMNLENTLRKQIASKGHVAKYVFEDIVGQSSTVSECICKAKKIALIDKPTLIIGESGTGKELFAQSIHNQSSRSRFPFVAMNCAAIPATLLESELFGYEEGSFTGASKGGKTGLFQMAHKGTLFLDEIGELSLPTQAKLLRVLEEKEIMKVGSGEIISVDVRIIAATNRNLNELVGSGEFRLDLYYRLNTLILNIPPLRSRTSDIPRLTSFFLEQEGLTHVAFDPEVTRFFMKYNWKGNVRELKNCVEYMAHISGGQVTMKHLPDYIMDEYEATTAKHKVLQRSIDQLNSQETRAVIHILSIVREHSAGRRTIQSMMSTAGFDITEYKLRTALQYLSEKNYIHFGKGRTGSVITKEGEQLLKALLDSVNEDALSGGVPS